MRAEDVLRGDSSTKFVLLFSRKADGSFDLDLAGERDYEAILSALGSAAAGVMAELEKKVQDLLLKAGRAAL